MQAELGIVGQGKLGLPLSLVFAHAGFKVVGIDLSKERIKQILTFLEKESAEPNVSQYLRRHRDNAEFSTDYAKLEHAAIVVVITQTPSLPSGRFDVTYVKKAVQQVHEVNENALIVVSSNINIGTIDTLKQIHRRICYNPEFVKQGSIIHDFENPKFVVIGAYRKEDGKLLADTWRRVHSKPIHIVEPVEAEIIKLSLNFSYCLGITFANMIGELCEEFKAHSSMILDIIYQDRRNYTPGLGYGGPCFPRDVNCFEAICQLNDVESGCRLAQLLERLNVETVERYVEEIKSVAENAVAVLGVAYKPGVPYIYESQALKIAQELCKQGYQVHIYDPPAEENARQVLNSKQAVMHDSLDECVAIADAVFIGTSNYKNTKTEKPTINPWK